MPHKPPQELTLWNRRAGRSLEDLLDTALNFPALRKRGPKTDSWQAGVRVVGSATIRKLNSHYRGKDKPTDVLSFHAPEPFWSAGYLGELVIALPVLKKQAREYQHSPGVELQVLIAHGLLHLLGLDHEKSAREAREQAAWEGRLLQFLQIDTEQGLIGRAPEQKTRKGTRKKS